MKDMAKLYFTFIIYTFLPVAIQLIAKYVFNFSFANHLLFLNVLCDSVFLVIFVLMHLDVFKTMNKVEGKNRNEKISYFIEKVIVTFFVFLAVKVAAGIVVTAITSALNLSDTSRNQQLVKELFKSAPILNIVTGAIFAPIVEELVFRGAVRRIITDKRVFVTVSGLLFGLVHVIRYDLPIYVILILGCLINTIVTSQLSKKKKVGLSILATIVMTIVMGLSLHCVSGDLITLLTTINLSEAANSIIYITMGIYLAIIYVKYDNIYINIACHCINNLLGYMALLTLL